MISKDTVLDIINNNEKVLTFEGYNAESNPRYLRKYTIKGYMIYLTILDGIVYVQVLLAEKTNITVQTTSSNSGLIEYKFEYKESELK